MTDIEKYIRLVLDNVYTSLPCKVVEYDANTRFAKCSLMIKTEKEGNTPLIRVPILRMVGGSVPLKVGMIIPVWFTKYSLGEFVVSLSENTVKGPLECYQFTRDSAYGLPFLFDDKLNIKMPEFVEFDTKVIFKEDVVMEKTLNVTKDIEAKSSVKVTGDVAITGNLDVAGNSTLSGGMSSPNYDSHTHLDAEGRPTTKPQ